jgi:hypothetical protein
MGCILMRREVIDDPRMMVDRGDDRRRLPFRTVRKPDGTVEIGENIDFTWRAQLDSSVRCGHEKTVDLADVEAWAGRDGQRRGEVREKKRKVAGGAA